MDFVEFCHSTTRQYFLWTIFCKKEYFLLIAWRTKLFDSEYGLGVQLIVNCSR